MSNVSPLIVCSNAAFLRLCVRVLAAEQLLRMHSGGAGLTYSFDYSLTLRFYRCACDVCLRRALATEHERGRKRRS